MTSQEIKSQVQTETKKAIKTSSWQAEKPKRPSLRFSPTAWAKLLYFRDKTDNEIGGFGITEPDDLLFVKEFVTVKQEVTGVTVKFDDTAVADFFDSQVDLGRKPEQFARTWLHTHPGNSPEPSMVDEETFTRVFGNCQWAVMFVLAQDNKTYARLRFNVGPGGEVLIPVEINYNCDFEASDKNIWDAEYQANIKAGDRLGEYGKNDQTSSVKSDVAGYALPYDFINELEKMEPAERQLILDELADRPDLWDEEREAMYL
jgi:proteasome lid subunit RPN8/RPN11